MDKSSKSRFLILLEEKRACGDLPEKVVEAVLGFYLSVKNTLLEVDKWMDSNEQTFLDFLEYVHEQVHHPHQFADYHQRIRSPHDYYQFGVDFLSPLVDKDDSSLVGRENLDRANLQLQQRENIVFFANHQTEADPQAISILFGEAFAKLAEEMIFVAGERVILDPLAIPFSMGRNLLCIYSKRYIAHPPEQKHEKQLHNKRTMQLMSKMLNEGGKCIYVAPSGGRDRRAPSGEIEIASFDPKSIEMFYLMTKKAQKATHFYPMSLATYELLPPPETVQIELGEERQTEYGGIHALIGSEIDMEIFPGSDLQEKLVRRKARADYIWGLVKQGYQDLRR